MHAQSFGGPHRHQAPGMFGAALLGYVSQRRTIVPPHASRAASERNA